MRLRPSLLVLPVIAVALLASGCFESRTAGTVSTPITVGVGTAETEISPAGTTSTPATSSTPSTASTPATSTTTTATTGSASTTATTGGAASYPPAAKAKFTTTCGGCHTMADAGTSGTIGPDLDQLKPDAATVAHQIENGGGAMPAGLLKGQDVKDVAAYVAAVAGKAGG